MAKEIVFKTWEGDDGKRYATEIEALRADRIYWKNHYEEVNSLYEKITDKEPRSSYGSSGGGGHD